MFSDEDLKRLKAYKWEWGLPLGEQIAEIRNNISGLVSRLEAAEWAMSELERHDRKGYLHDDLKEPLAAWRKSAGKEI